jgi:protein-L-isoaspartate(D-aspartate) O-methyltransferase
MAPGEAEAADLNERLIAHLKASGALADPALAAAFRAVRRHHFLPGRPLEEVYEDVAILTKVAGRGAALSSSSQPAIMAVMLRLLEPASGHRVLEIGAGTGYNAALLAHLVGPTGGVVTLDIDDDLCWQARANLARAGVRGAQVVRADGADGWAAAAPYDRLILTVAANDLSPAWLAQLHDGGRLVLPLDVGEGIQVCTALVRRGRALEGGDLAGCGFMPLRGGMAPPQPALAGRLPDGISGPGRPTGHRVGGPHLWDGFATWLGITQAGAVRARPRPEDPPAFGLRDERGLALLVGDGPDYEITIFGDGDAAAERLRQAHRAWEQGRPRPDRLRLDAYPAGEEPAGLAGVRILHRRRFTFVVREAA